MSERRLKALVRGIGQTALLSLGLLMLFGLGVLVATLWFENPLFGIAFVGAVIAYLAVLGIVVAIAEWAGEE